MRSNTLLTFHSSLIIPRSSFSSYSRRLVLLAVVGVFERDCLAGARVLREQVQGVAQHRALKLAHAGAAKAVAHLESLRVERARRAHLRRHFGTHGYQDRRDASHLYLALYRHDRAVTHARSTARQHDHVGARAPVYLVGNLGRRPFVHRLELHRVAHVADVLLRDLAYEAFLLQIAQHVEGEDDVDVLVGVRVVVVVVRDHQTGRVRVVGYDAEAEVA